eukprot:scaffold1170_cov174-Amphora_coffeaeformis.AAC.35
MDLDRHFVVLVFGCWFARARFHATEGARWQKPPLCTVLLDLSNVIIHVEIRHIDKITRGEKRKRKPSKLALDCNQT